MPNPARGWVQHGLDWVNVVLSSALGQTLAKLPERHAQSARETQGAGLCSRKSAGQLDTRPCFGRSLTPSFGVCPTFARRRHRRSRFHQDLKLHAF